MAKPFLRVRLDKPMAAKPAPKTPKIAPKGAAKPAPKPMPLVKPGKNSNAAASAVIDRANRAQAREAQIIRTTVRERTTPPKKK
jgi:hypothetical protein